MASSANPVNALADPAATLLPATSPVREWLLTIAGLGLSVAVLLAVLVQLGGIDTSRFASAPANPWFWLCFALFYALGPAMEWLILHRLWKLRADAVPALFRKQVANEIVFGYSGDAQFYLWARQHQPLKGSVFGTLRDVTVLSALAGNLATLIMMAVNAPLLYAIAGGALLNSFVASVAVIILSSLGIVAMRRFVSLLTLSRRDLIVTFGLHSLRIVLSLVLTALLWKLLLPDLSPMLLIAVATLRMMVHRLPLIPARDALLAPLILALLGPGSGLAAATMLVAALTLVTHMAVGAITSIASLLSASRPSS